MGKRNTNEAETRTLKKIINNIPRRLFLKGRVMRSSDIVKTGGNAVLNTDFKETGSSAERFDIGEIFRLTGQVRCLAPKSKETNNDTCEVEARHLKNKTLHWLPCRSLVLVSVVTSVGECATDKKPPQKEKNHPRHKGARHHKHTSAASPPPPR